MRDRLPLPWWVRGYRKEWTRGDVIAGLTVAVMLIPQGMAYAALAGMPPVTGLYAAIVAIIAYALVGTSGSLAVGPVAITSLLTLSGLEVIAEPGSPTYPALAALLALTVGAVLLIAGGLRLGFLVNFLSHPVISGFTSAAAIVIGLSQVKDILGIDIGRPDGAVGIVAGVVREVSATSWVTLAVGAGAILVLAAGKWLVPRAPVALAVMVAATGLSLIFGLKERGVAVVGDIPGGFPGPSLPESDWETIRRLIPVALTVALVAYAEGVSVAKAIARRTRQKVDANRELVANGAANVAAGLFGGFPVAGGFSRTAVNHQAGARTPLAGLVTAVVLGVTVLWLTPLLHHLPKAVLAAVVIVAVAGLVDVRDALETWRVRRADLAALAVTFAATLGIGVEPGLAIGLAFSLVQYLARSSNPHMTELGRVEGTREYRNVTRWPTVRDPRVVLVRLDAPLFFANAKVFEDRIAALLAERPEVIAVIVDASGVGDLDVSGANLLSELDADLAASGVTLHLATVRGPVRDVLARSGQWDRFEGRVHPNLTAAIAACVPGSMLLEPRPGEHPLAVV